MRSKHTPRALLVTLALVLPIAAACTPRASSAPSADPFAAWRPFLECTIDHESRSAGTYSANTGNGYHGAYQFAQSTWDGAVTRAGHGEWAGQSASSAPPEVQDAAAVQLASERGAQPWGGRCAGLLP